MHPQFTLTLAIAGGGAIGSAARYWTGLAAAALWGTAFPWGTLIINIAGSFIIGLTATMTLPHGPLPASDTARAFVMAGFCGGYTTFSAFSLQTWDLLRAGQTAAALGNIAASVMLCLIATIAGHFLALRLGG